MKTVKQVSVLTGVSIRTLRYYDEINILKPASITDAGYRLYDDKCIEKLQQILFFRELEIPLKDVKQMMDTPSYDREKVLEFQRSMLVRKRNHLNRLIELIDDVKKGANTMSFEAFNESDINKIVNHTLKHMQKEVLEKEAEKYGGLAQYREYLANGFQNEQATSDLIKWYGSKDKAVEAVLHSTGDANELEQEQDKVNEVYKLFVKARDTHDGDLATEAVAMLAECYKAIFRLDNARAILLDLATEYSKEEKLAKFTDVKYGIGASKYVADRIYEYYGERVK